MIRLVGFKLPLIALAAISIAPSGFGAPLPAWEFTTPGSAITSGSWALGIDFTVGGSDILVTALGFYDHDGDGFLTSHEVGIYDSGANLLTSGLVQSSDPLSGHFRYVNIAPLTLLAGQTYRVVGVSHNDLYTWDPAGFILDPRITFVADMFQSSSTLIYPTSGPSGVIGYFGPAFLADDVDIPEPGSMALVGLGLVGLGWARRGWQRNLRR